MERSIGISSRGEREEQEQLIKNLLHSEVHIQEEIQKHPDKSSELLKDLDEVRTTRQRAVEIFANGKANPDFWCENKHMFLADMHAGEVLNNFSRTDRDKGVEFAEISQRIGGHKDRAVKKFLSGSSKSSCARCVGDLNTSSSEGVEQVEEKNNFLGFFLLILGIGLTAFAIKKLSE